MLKEGSRYICLSAILTDSVFRTDKNYYLFKRFEKNENMFSKKKKIPKYITEDTEISSDQSDKEDQDKENSKEEDSDEE